MAAPTTDLSELSSLAGAFRDVPEVANVAARLALVSGARKARTLGVNRIYDHKNLTKSYIRKHLRVRQFASGNDLVSRIGATPRAVLLTRYGARQQTTRTLTPARRLKGDASRGIRPGRKAAGIRGVQVNRGGERHFFEHAFFIRLRRGLVGNASAWGVAIRTGPGRNDYDIAHSTSVDQAWRNVRDEVLPEVMDYTEREFIRQFDRLSR